MTIPKRIGQGESASQGALQGGERGAWEKLVRAAQRAWWLLWW